MTNTTNSTSIATFGNIEKLIARRSELTEWLADIETQHADAEKDIMTLLTSMKEYGATEIARGSVNYRLIDRKVNAVQRRNSLQQQIHEIDQEIQAILYWGNDYQPEKWSPLSMMR